MGRVWLMAGVLAAMSAVSYGQTAPAFDVVSVKPSKPGNGMRVNMEGDQFGGTNLTMKLLIEFAYGLRMPEQVVGLSGPVSSARYDIEAKMDAETIAAMKKMTEIESDKQRQTMMQALLADRFHMKAHREVKEMQVYDLVEAKGGCKLKPVAGAENEELEPGKGPDGKFDGKMHPGMIMMMPSELTAQAIPLDNLANVLSNTLHKQVIDKTGLKGMYDVTLKFMPENGPAPMVNGEAQDLPSIFTAVQEQLGLELKPVKAPVETIVIDSIAVPTEN